jgi:hypothetical protein
MHLFEAALAWAEIDAGWSPMADGLAACAGSGWSTGRSPCCASISPTTGRRRRESAARSRIRATISSGRGCLDQRSGGEDALPGKLVEQGEAVGVDPVRASP